MPADSLAQALLLAARALTAVLAGRSLSEASAAWLAAAGPTRSEAQEITYGALRRFAQGDAILRQLLARPPAQPEVRALLLGALHRLQARPESAYVTVSQAVEAAGCLGGAWRGLVNGVLRNYLRRQAELHAALAADAAAQHWHPEWWLQRLRADWPDDWPQIVAAGNAQPPQTLRINRRRGQRADYLEELAQAGIAARSFGESGVRIVKPQPSASLPGFLAGRVAVQDAGAQRAAELLDLADGQRVLDACAAPGGKAAHALEIAAIDLTALEIDAGRAGSIEENFARLGLRGAVRVADARRPADWWDGQAFARILADVPCSASGVVRRHPDAKWLRRPDDIAAFARTQRQILHALWPCLAAGGKLLYATCSLFNEENRVQIERFLAAVPTAQLLHEERLLPQDDHDGFYYALLQKKPGAAPGA